MKFLKRCSILLLLLATTGATFAQETGKTENFMYSSGRIYVVVAVMVTILLGLILYMIRIDRKISKLEKE